MVLITTSDFIKKPSYITNPSNITFVEDAKKHKIKSVVIPYNIYEKIKEQIEDEIYLMQNKKALSKTAQKEFEIIEEAFIEDDLIKIFEL